MRVMGLMRLFVYFDDFVVVFVAVAVVVVIVMIVKLLIGIWNFCEKRRVNGRNFAVF